MSYVTVTDTVAGLLTAPVLSVTVRLKTRDVATVGAVKVGVAVVAPVSDTGVPDVCTHEYDTIVPPFGEKLPVPTNVTREPWLTVSAEPALAIGCDTVVDVVPVIVDVVVGTQKLFCITKPVGHVPVAVLVPVVEDCCPCKSP